MGYTDAPEGWWQGFIAALPAALPPEMVVRVTPTKVTAKVDVAD